MFVNTEQLHSGGNQSHRAGGHAQEGADHLAGGTLESGMFGDFEVANSFHNAVTTAHGQHVKTCRATARRSPVSGRRHTTRLTGSPIWIRTTLKN